VTQQDERLKVKTKKANVAKHPISQTTTPHHPPASGSLLTILQLGVGKKVQKTGSDFTYRRAFFVPPHPPACFCRKRMEE